MTNQISEEVKKQLEDLYYKQGNMFGRDKLYKLAVSRDIPVTRRALWEWLKLQEIHQLYWPAEESKELQSTVLNKPHDQIGIDLIDMQNYEYNNYKYILTAIDLFSKKAYAVALKDKSNREANRGIKNIISDARPKSIRSDNGSEFISQSFKKILKDNNIKQVLSSPGLPQSNGNIERFNGILKNMINKDLMYNNTYNWFTPLQKLVDNYNNSYHTTIKETPNNIDSLDDENKLIDIRRRIYNAVISKRKSLMDHKFNVGDTVRINLKDDKTKQNWSNELYNIQKVGRKNKIYTAPYYYISSIYDNKIISEKYYDNDLLLVPINTENKIKKVEKYEISKILEFKQKNGKDMYVVKWRGYKQPTLEPYDMLVQDVPKLLHRFDRENNITH